MFGFSKRRKKERYLKTATRVQALERRIFSQIRPQFVERHGDLPGRRLGQAAVDKLFGRVPALSPDDATLAERLAAEIATENKTIRDAAFISLRAMLEVEGECNNFGPERRVLDTIQWLKQFGEIPGNASDPDALEIVSESFCEATNLNFEAKAAVPPVELPILDESWTKRNERVAIRNGFSSRVDRHLHLQ